jgi:hypothetical protein
MAPPSVGLTIFSLRGEKEGHMRVKRTTNNDPYLAKLFENLKRERQGFNDCKKYGLPTEVAIERYNKALRRFEGAGGRLALLREWGD